MSQTPQPCRQSPGTRVYPGGAAALPAGSATSSRCPSAQPQAHGIWQTDTNLHQPGEKPKNAGKSSSSPFQRQKDTDFCFHSHGKNLTQHDFHMCYQRSSTDVTGRLCPLPFKRTATSKASTAFQKTKSFLNMLVHRVQGILLCAQANLWAEVLKRLVLGLVLTGNKNKNTKTKTPG